MPVTGGAKQLTINHVSILPIVVVCAKGAFKGFRFYLECGLGLFNKLTANFKCALIAIDGRLVIVTVVFAFFCATIATSNVLGWGVVATGTRIYGKTIVGFFFFGAQIAPGFILVRVSFVVGKRFETNVALGRISLFLRASICEALNAIGTPVARRLGSISVLGQIKDVIRIHFR